MIKNTESITAKLCSMARAYHSNNERNKIFDDYLAFDLLGKEEYERIGSMYKDKLNQFLEPIPLSRAAFAENELAKFARKNKTFQYVICGAGMDTFAFRNENPDIQIYEIDHPDTQNYKLERIKKLEWIMRPNAHYVSVDFLKDDMIEKLLESGFDPSIPSFFAILGVSYYLDLSVFEETLKKISSISAPGSKLIFDYPDETTFTPMTSSRVHILSELTKELGEKMLHGYSIKEIMDALAKSDYSLAVHESPVTIQNKYFSDRKDGKKAYENIHFIVAERVSLLQHSEYHHSLRSAV